MNESDEAPSREEQAALEASLAEVEGDLVAECCHFCGKPLDEFGDLGCAHCDRRHPEFGMQP